MLVSGGYGGSSHALGQVVREQLGDFVHMNFTSTHRWRIDPKLGVRPEWNYSREKYGGAVVVDGIHSLNNLRWLTGREVKAITATHSNRAMPEHPEFEDNFAILVELVGGGTATLSFSWLTPQGEPTHGRSSMTILGTKGLFETRSTVADQPVARQASLEEGVVRGSETETILTVTEPSRRITLPRLKAPTLEEDFVASVSDPSYTPTLLPEWIFESTRLTLLARQSADEGRRIALR
jgi:predicted dehydrogenase